jgi:predicted GH43/DUF377 family glycosyl hydrolase
MPDPILNTTLRTGLLASVASVLVGCGATSRYVDARPETPLRMDARDYGVVLRHGTGPDSCDAYGARDVWVYKTDSSFIMHYDGAGPLGWLSVRARSTDLLNWTIDGPVLSLGKEGDEDSKSASYGITARDSAGWHMFYLGTRFTSPPPDRVPSLPYVTLKARSHSPLGPWQKQPGFVALPPTPGTYYSHTASPGQIIRHDGEYLQFFSAAVMDGKIHRTLGIARTRNLDSSWTISPQPILPLDEQIENSALYFEEATGTWFLFTNHVGLYKGEEEFTDAIWVYWSKDVFNWNPADKAVVLDGRNCSWSKRAIGLPSLVRFGDRLALFYDGLKGRGYHHTRRDIGLAWLRLPLRVPTESP